MKRAAAIIAAVERVEAEVTTNPVRMITPAAMALIVRELARAALDEVVRRDAVAQVRTEAEADAARAGLEHEIARLRRPATPQWRTRPRCDPTGDVGPADSGNR